MKRFLTMGKRSTEPRRSRDRKGEMASILRSQRRQMRRDEYEKEHGYSMSAHARRKGYDAVREQLRKDAEKKTRKPIRLFEGIKRIFRRQEK